MSQSTYIRKNIKLLKWFNFFEDFRLYAPVAIIYFSKLSGSYALGMSIFSLVFISQAIFEIPTGILSDIKLHRKGSMLCGACSVFLSIVFYAIAKDYSLLVIGAVFEGIARSFFSGTDSALLYETLKETDDLDNYEKHQGEISSMFQIATFISSLLGAVALLHSYKLVMYLTIVPKICQIFTSLFFVEPKKHTNKFTESSISHTKKAWKSLKNNKKLRWFSIAKIIGFSFGEASFQFQSAFVQMLVPDWAISAIKSFNNLGAALSFWFSGKLIKQFGYFKIFFNGSLVSGVINIFAVIIQNIFSPFLLALPSLLFGITMTAESSVMQKEFTDEQRATMGSLISFFGSVAFALISVSIGYIADLYGAVTALLLCHIIPKIIVLPIYWKILKHK